MYDLFKRNNFKDPANNNLKILHPEKTEFEIWKLWYHQVWLEGHSRSTPWLATPRTGPTWCAGTLREAGMPVRLSTSPQASFPHKIVLGHICTSLLVITWSLGFQMREEKIRFLALWGLQYVGSYTSKKRRVTVKSFFSSSSISDQWLIDWYRLLPICLCNYLGRAVSSLSR